MGAIERPTLRHTAGNPVGMATFGGCRFAFVTNQLTAAQFPFSVQRMVEVT